MIEELCKWVEHPLIFPLSNPTSKAEITAKEAYEWSNGKAVFAAGERSWMRTVLVAQDDNQHIENPPSY